MNKTLKRYIISTLVTFFSAFLSAFLLYFESDVTIELATLKIALVSAIYSGIRAVIKYLVENKDAIVEFLLNFYSKKS